MINGIEAGISSLKAFEKRQAVSANNLANSETNNFKATSAHIEEGLNGSLKLTTQIDDSPGTLLTEEDGSAYQTSNVDIARELTDMIPTQHAYSANLTALKVYDDMNGTLLDLKA